ncbi:MAG: LysE family transporter [Christensenellales bacterium]
MVPIFLSALAVGFSGAMMPGSLLTYTIRQSLSQGPKSGFIIILGHALLELVLLVLIFLGLDIILQSQAAQIGIGIVGGLFLLYMGFSMILQSARNKVSVQMEEGKASAGNMFFSGIAISAASPYFLLWWAVIGLSFVMQSYNALGYLGVAVYFIGHMTADVLWYGAVSCLVGTTRRFIKATIYRIIIAVLGGLLVFFGGSFVYGAIVQLI